MPTPTYTALANITLGSSQNTVTFSSIPSSFRDVVLIGYAPATSGNEILMRFNGDTGSNYSRVYMEGRASAASASGTNDFAYVGSYGDKPASLICHFMDYSATDKHKTVLARGDSTDGTKATAVRWANTAAITTILVKHLYDPLPAGTTLALYGIAS